MSYVVLASPLHVLPQEIDMPVMRDGDAVGTAIGFRRRYVRPLSAWQLEIPGKQELLDPILQLLEYAQGDTPIWFDGAGFGEITSPSLVWIADGTTFDIRLPHRWVFIASLIIYINGAVYTDWTALGGDGVTCDKIRTGTAVYPDYHVTAKYRRKIKCLVRIEDKVTRQRVHRGDINANNIHSMTVTLQELAS